MTIQPEFLENPEALKVASNTVNTQRAIAQALIGLSAGVGAACVGAAGLVYEPTWLYVGLGGALGAASAYEYAASVASHRSGKQLTADDFDPEKEIDQIPSIEDLETAHKLADRGYKWSLAAPVLLAAAFASVPGLLRAGLPVPVAITGAFVMLLAATGAAFNAQQGLYKSINIFGNQEGRLYYYLTEVPGFKALLNQVNKEDDKA